MREFRKDPILGRWVIFSSDRAGRPMDFPGRMGGRAVPEQRENCPFCPGREAETPPEVLALGRKGEPDTSGWEVRVVPNKYPALVPEGEPRRRRRGLFLAMDGVGSHEVVILGPDHRAGVDVVDGGHLSRFLTAARDRMRVLSRDDRMKYVLFFMNHGEAAGATLEHPHAQMIATPILPRQVAEELIGARKHFERTGTCVFCGIVSQEIAEGSRLIGLDRDFATLAPFASRSPFEAWVLPRGHASSFERLEDARVPSLAGALGELVRRMNRVLDTPAYNVVLHTGPARDPELDHYHWHLELIPKLLPVAGFEWGSGFTINTVPPERAGAALRGVEEAEA